MRVLFSIAVSLAILSTCFAAYRRDVSQSFQGVGGVSLDQVVTKLNLGDNVQLQPAAKLKTAQGHILERVIQKYGGLEVIGAHESADVEVTPETGAVGAVSGSLAYDLQRDIPDTTACVVANAALVQKAKAYLAESERVTITDDMTLENLEAVRKIYFDEDGDPAKLVYELKFVVDVYPDSVPMYPFFLLDVCDGNLAVLVYFNKINNMTMSLERNMRQDEDVCDTTLDTTPGPVTTASPNEACGTNTRARGFGGNPKTGKITYGQNMPFCLRPVVDGNTCTMRSNFGDVYDLGGGTSHSGKSPIQFQCDQGYSDPVNQAYGVANDAFHYGYATGLMYEQWYGVQALSHTPKLRVHYKRSYENAFWNGRDMTFGDGASRFYPLTVCDVVGHELGHGFTEQNSNLYYTAQSGSINEAFSDMAGTATELFATGEYDWLIGKYMMKNKEALRYMNNPPQDGSSIDNYANYNDGYGIHYSSGIFNKAFYHIVETEGISLKDAFHIFVTANRLHWSTRSTFVHGACGAMKAAFSLGFDVNKVSRSFNKVGVSTTDCNFQSVAQSLADGEVRQGVTASVTRNPLFKLDEPVGSTVVVNAVTEDNLQVTVSITSDPAGAEVVATGTAPFTFHMTENTNYIKFSAASDNDAVISISVRQA